MNGRFEGGINWFSALFFKWAGGGDKRYPTVKVIEETGIGISGCDMQ